MKSLIDFITEDFNNKTLREVVVKFGIEETDLVVEVPDSYLEDQIQTYLDDTIINKTFIGPDYSKDTLSKNADSVVDAYFEYTSLSHTSLSPEIEWDNKYETKNIDVKELKNMKLKDFKFVVVFDKFEILGKSLESDEDIHTILKDIFNMCISDEYEYPLNFTLDEDDIEFKK